MWGSPDARKRMLAVVGAVSLGLLVALVLLVGAHGGTVAAAGIATPTPTSAIAPNVQLIQVEGGTFFDTQSTVPLVLDQYTFVAGKGAVNILANIQFTTSPALTSLTPVDTLVCQTYLDNIPFSLAGAQWDVTGGTINNTHVLAGTTPLTKGTHTISVKCSTDRKVTLFVHANLDLAVVTGATSINLTSQG
jgi:hypothetical protein